MCNNFYQKPFELTLNMVKNYGVREVKKQYPNRYKINGVWWSEKQLKNKIKIDPKTLELFIENELPF